MRDEWLGIVCAIVVQGQGFAAGAGMWRPCGAALTLALSRTAQRNVFAV